MNEEVVWLYKVLDTEKMSAEELQSELDRWSNHVMPHELIQQGNKLIVKFQSGLTRRAFFGSHENTFRSAVD